MPAPAPPQLSRSSSASTLSAVPTTPPAAPAELPPLPPLVSKPIAGCKELSGAALARPIKALLSPALARLERPLRIVGLLATPDAGCATYAALTARACRAAGVEFETLDLRLASSSLGPEGSEGSEGSEERAREETEEARFVAVLGAIHRLNADDTLDGLLVYFPLFGARDGELRAAISPRIDVEGVSPASLAASAARPPQPLEELFRAPAHAAAYPCTAAAVFHTLAQAGVPRSGTVTVVNRSETVGRPLAAMLANAGATVYSADIGGVQLWRGGEVGPVVEDIDTPLPALLAQSDAVVAAVPGQYTVPTGALKRGAACVDLSAGGNFAQDVRDRAGTLAPRVGAVTIAMLMANALVLRHKAGRERGGCSS